ncbi:MAG: hypothetical protein K2J08_02990 [Ruminococcus sp.]|nr:hypothetical protein [Ruminococcus sp.]
MSTRFCGYCGKELRNGSRCDCKESLDSGIYGGGIVTEEIKTAVSDNRRQIIIGLVCMLIIIYALIRITVFIFSGNADEPVVRSTRRDYEKPVTDFVSAYNRNNAWKMIKTMLPSDYIDSEKKKADDEWEDFITSLEDSLEKEKDRLELDLGKNIRLSAEIIDKKELNNSELKEITEIYSGDFGADDIKSSYKLKVEFLAEGYEDYDIDKHWVYVVEIKGDGWLLCPKGDGYNPGEYIGLKYK